MTAGFDVAILADRSIFMKLVYESHGSRGRERRVGQVSKVEHRTSRTRRLIFSGMCRHMTVSENVVRLTIASQLEFIDLVTNLTDCLTNMAGFDEEAVYWINMAVRESVANAVEHGNQYDPNKAVDVTFVLSPEHLHVSVRDRGEGFDPANLPDPLDPLNLLNPAGRGILYMRTFMDQVDYQTHPEGGMIVSMVKSRQPKDSSLATDNSDSKNPHHDAIGN